MTRTARPLPGIAEAAAAFAERRRSPSELLEEALAGIERHRHLNAFITVDEDGARSLAAASDRRWRAGRPIGPCDGCVIAVKDVIDVRGLPTTAGSAVLQSGAAGATAAGATAAGASVVADATVVARLRAAGAVLIGKTHLHEFALGGTGENRHLGDARNPWNPDRISGGSSSGSAIAVAAGMAQAALGTDTGGSVRGPASLCGVVGFKPTFGRIATDGVIPSGWSLDCVGTLTLAAGDAALLFEAAAIGDAGRPGTRADRTPRGVDRAAPGVGPGPGDAPLRVAVPERYFFDRLAEDVRRVVAAALARLPELGWQLQPVPWPDAEHAASADAVSWTLNSAEAAAFHEPWITSRPLDYGEDVRARLELGRGLLAGEYLRAQRLRRLLQQELSGIFAQADLVVTPACPVTAFAHGTVSITLDGEMMPAAGTLNRCFRIANLLGWPAVTLPCGSGDDGLPVALQLMAPPNADEALLRAAQAFEARSGGLVRP